MPEFIDRRMQHLRKNGLIVGDQDDVQIDEPVPLFFIVLDDVPARRQFVADPGNGEILNFAAGMHPGRQHHVFAQR